MWGMSKNRNRHHAESLPTMDLFVHLFLRLRARTQPLVSFSPCRSDSARSSLFLDPDAAYPHEMPSFHLFSYVWLRMRFQAQKPSHVEVFVV